jgi:tetratricopeptide (TPR) repeat protein/predicted Ser/Thr protein kinase
MSQPAPDGVAPSWAKDSAARADADPSAVGAATGLLGPPPRWELEETATREDVAQRLFGRSHPRTIGRFELGARLGAGGMGEVWAAFDPKLERPVALKTLRASAFSRASARRGLIDEARALARLRHDNVLAVHDVLEIDDLVVIVMERVDGEVLRTWAHRDDVGRERVLAALESAARGLIAAHEAGVAHFDFKPDNVLVDRHGRVRVADFGLAHRLDRPQTFVGGTPGFAAPEQWRRSGGSDARADQFAFASTVCAVLGMGPALGLDDPSGLDDSIFRARIRVAVERTGLSRNRRRALTRALARSPEQRWLSMAALADALFVRPRVRARRAAIVGGATLAIALGMLGSTAFDDPPICAGVTAQQWLARAWDPDQREAFLSTAASNPDLEPAARVAAERLDERRRELELEWPQVCETGLLDADESIAIRRCVERRRGELVTVARMFGDPSPGMLERAPRIVAELGTVADCLLAAESEPRRDFSPEQLDRIGQLHARLAEAGVHRHAGERVDQRNALTLALEIATALGDPSSMAEVEIHLGHMQVEDGETEVGLARVERGYFAAVASGDELLAADTANRLVFLAGAQGRDAERGHRWADHAHALFDKLDADPIRRARLSAYRGALAETEGDLAASLAHYRRSLDLLVDVDAPELRIVVLNGIAVGLGGTGDSAGALATFGELEPILRAEYGDRHPHYAVLINNIGAAKQAIGEFEAAIEHHEHARVIADAQGLDRLKVHVLVNLCFAHNSAGHDERGLSDCRAGLELCLAVFTGDKAMCSSAYMALGNTLATISDGPGALAAYREVFDGYAESYAPDDPLMAWAWSSMGAGHLAVGAWSDARDAYRRAIELATAAGFPAAEVAEIRFGLAKALDALGEPEAARELAHEAATAYLQAGHDRAEAEIRDWLASRPEAG